MQGKTMAIGDLFEAQAETPLSIVNKILLSGKFTPIEEPIEEGESVIGELTPFEWALNTARKKIADAHNNMMRKMVPFDHIEAQKNMENHNVIESLFWASIRNRLGEVAFKSSTIGVKSGGKIVSVNNGQDHIDLLKSLFGVAGNGVAVEVEHDCEHCPDYDRCDLPVKKEKKRKAFWRR